MNPLTLARNLAEVGLVVIDGLFAMLTPKVVETPVEDLAYRRGWTHGYRQGRSEAEAEAIGMHL